MVRYSIEHSKTDYKWVVWRISETERGINYKGVYHSNNYNECKLFIKMRCANEND